MKDTIYRQAAIDAIENTDWYHQNRNKDMVSGANSKEDQPWYKAEDVYNALENVPSVRSRQECEKCIFRPFKQFQPEPQWIPCSESLPKKERQQYWICTDTGYQCQCRWTDNVYGFGPSDNWGWKIFDIPPYQKVVAWMSLPKPYKGEER